MSLTMLPGMQVRRLDYLDPNGMERIVSDIGGYSPADHGVPADLKKR
jgi:hypothetical protein